MLYHHSLCRVPADRDLTRAANERYLMLQVLSEREGWVPGADRSRIQTFLHAVRALWATSSPRSTVTAERASTAR